ncbi:uncharacterized protein EKO05_0006266 [Ascochyta rabiei]|uniref:Uncharacterized protein n=1 Tax=Didymella rabiei TaxID=5454 RepID=A0A163AY11_DIDRA|nr:uncharacterized protein EKO05_0006266 [Ascochyta rabiei]KZM21459.1 hypothetical protein ST47_g7361 [Ascochyta rabiei]UPX15829.1 hypothetical protein EKO05_0006266 [Ascochyta rabiei]
MVRGALTNTFVFRLKLRRRFSISGIDDVDETSDESDLKEDSDSDLSEEPLPEIRGLPQFPSVLRLCGEGGDERAQRLYDDDFQAYHETAGRETAELKLQV